MRKICVGVAALAMFAGSLSAKEFINIGTGGMTGTYYPVGTAICRLVNTDKNFKCSVQSTGGSTYNVNNVLKKELNFGFVQSDVVYDKYNGKGKFEGEPNPKLRSVISIYPELLAFVVARDSGIKAYADIDGKKINLGNPGSGNEVTSTLIFNEYGIDLAKMAQRSVLTVQECPMALKDKKIDGYFFMVGHPTANIIDVATSMSVDLVGIDEATADKIVEKYPYFAKGVIPKGLYEGIDYDTTTIGVKAVLVADESESDTAVRAIVKAILDNFDEYKQLHPALNLVSKESLIEGLSAPLHPAAEAVFKEAGILK
ncbi:TAXI family TRAP transporter solute-binding subunit [Campylobacter sp. JMF_08 NE1]|uniref:TAXI family TRAP transporter solute-binding subunit n=1 Tax=Campylobacter sp. JMF_08 NE1 TaxID=2983821 RepID=UPI0022EA0BF2|nr:TAXI family TRAP transporter solute-binding subunit [Campylobacter sp. JMF_08 NE1]MDA3047620.1 TAXI family TRAP transporter solute-binding subunit [Campylobacter sp. JMF_08 NE1]